MKKQTQKTMFAIKKRSYCGWNHECEYATREEAQAAFDKMRQYAEKRTSERADWLAAHPKPWNREEQNKAFIEDYDSIKTPLEEFDERGWYIDEIEPTNCVYRLNTLPNESPELVREIEAKVAIFGDCELSWTCHGHTRSEWQSEAAAVQLQAMHPEWRVVNTGYSVSISIAA